MFDMDGNVVPKDRRNAFLEDKPEPEYKSDGYNVTDGEDVIQVGILNHTWVWPL